MACAWVKATGSLCPLPAKVKSHFDDGAAVGWDMQSVENVLCGISHSESPEEIFESTMEYEDTNKHGEPIIPWKPNPCCALEYAELYGR